MPNNHKLVVSPFGRRVERLAATLLSTQSLRMCRAWGIKSAAALSIVGAALLAFTQRSAAQPFNQVIVFGDSNVDSGYFKALSSPGGSSAYNSLWASAVAHGAGAPTTSPGLVSSQALANFFGLTANPANTAGGTNYATSGAKNEEANTAANGGFTAAIPTGTQIHNYLLAHGGVADSQALYLIWSGDNNVSYANGDSGTGPYPGDPDGYVEEAAEDLNGDILILHKAGARHIIVSGLAYDFPMGSSADSVSLRALRLLYTQTLFQNLTQLGVTYYQADTDKVRLAIYNNPSSFGFTTISNTGSGPACTEPNGIATAWALLCSSNPSAPSTWTAPDAQTHLFADDEHLGTAGQQLMANYMYSLISVQVNATPAAGKPPLAVKFRAGGLPLPMTYTVDFGDGTTGALAKSSCFGMPEGGQGGIRCAGTAAHTYTQAGTYTTTISNASGLPVGATTITVRNTRMVHPLVSSTPPAASPPVATSPLTPQRQPLDQHF